MGWLKDLFLGYLIGAELDNGNVEAAKEYMNELSDSHSEENEEDVEED